MEVTIDCPWCSAHKVVVSFRVFPKDNKPICTSLHKNDSSADVCYYTRHGITPYGHAAKIASKLIKDAVIR